MKPLVIFGIGDFAQVARYYLDEDSSHEVVAFTVDRSYVASDNLLGLDVVPFEDIQRYYPPTACELFVAIGYSKLNRVRRQVFDRCKHEGFTLASYVSSRASCCGPVTVGENCFVFEGNVLQPFVTIGDNVVMWSGNHVGHHSTIEDDCFVASHAVISGRVRIQRGTFVGVNATIVDGVTIGAQSIIGAGALITRDTQANQVYRSRHTKPASVGSDRLWK